MHDSMGKRCRLFAWFMALIPLVLSGCGGGDDEAAAGGDAVLVCVSSTDVATLVEAVGGSGVRVTGFVKGEDDPHVVNATPSMVRALAEAELVVVVGLGLEEAWLPAMLEQAGGSSVKPGGQGYLDLSVNLRTIAGPEGRGVPGSFHPEDNPHYLADPVEGVKAAQAIAEKLSELRPEKASVFRQNAEVFSDNVILALVGEHVANKIDASGLEELAIAIETGELDAFPYLKAEPEVLGGWLGALRPYTDVPVVGDHDLWPYLARRYGVRVLGYLEPSPGVPPTVPHLQEVIATMKERDCRIILTVQYFDPQHAAFVAEATGAEVVPMANQPGGRPGTSSYLDFVNYNAGQLLEAVRSQAGDASTQDGSGASESADGA
ncbi:metal ABC transporter substrate-binding protein [Mucisphaera calidilacus]|uniref:Manganese ABC transporter substrate-binding lipoprotein n=1 Tax=Mucisphaera calidilacus TaxID=2527982 RepID=A0A518BXX1_9BACT|nr:metal ABC transporter substrate-binding protein [Mucisphaera calidilacus]QDU71821.1 Manganese ABC transporter substrate-binding lipoprotein precursor [Mucisphaera calidilacus]